MGSGQGVDELHADLVGAKNIAAEPDVDFGALDRGKHFRIGLVAAIENRRHLARRQFATGDPADRGSEAVERIMRRRVVPGHRIVAPNRPLQPASPAFHPVDAKSGIEDRPEDGGEPGKSDPADCGGNIAFGQERVDSDCASHDEMDGADKKRAAFKQRERRERKIHLPPPVLYLSPSRRALILAPDPIQDQRRRARLRQTRWTAVKHGSAGLALCANLAP